MKKDHLLQLENTLEKLHENKHDIVTIEGHFYYLRKLDKHDIAEYIEKIKGE